MSWGSPSAARGATAPFARGSGSLVLVGFVGGLLPVGVVGGLVLVDVLVGVVHGLVLVRRLFAPLLVSGGFLLGLGLRRLLVELILRLLLVELVLGLIAVIAGVVLLGESLLNRFQHSLDMTLGHDAPGGVEPGAEEQRSAGTNAVTLLGRLRLDLLKRSLDGGQQWPSHVDGHPGSSRHSLRPLRDRL